MIAFDSRLPRTWWSRFGSTVDQRQVDGYGGLLSAIPFEAAAGSALPTTASISGGSDTGTPLDLELAR